MRREISIVRWGEIGLPLLVFPPAGGDAHEVERFALVETLARPLAAGRIKVYSCDGLPARSWLDPACSPEERARLQLRFDEFLQQELGPFVRGDCLSPRIEIIAAGAVFGAFNALMALCRHPDLFRSAICMSGLFDLERFMDGRAPLDFHFASPLHFLPYLDDGRHIETLRQRFALFAMGEGQAEEPDESWRMADVLGARGVPNRVDNWGPRFDQDWSTWCAMLPHYVEELL